MGLSVKPGWQVGAGSPPPELLLLLLELPPSELLPDGLDGAEPLKQLPLVLIVPYELTEPTPREAHELTAAEGHQAPGTSRLEMLPQEKAGSTCRLPPGCVPRTKSSERVPAGVRTEARTTPVLGGWKVGAGLLFM